MESFLPLGGFQLPFQRRLSRLYNDTKKSSDFVKEPISEDPEIKAMHRKLKIQKDRLVSWGLEWSDPSNQLAEIDESLSKAGLSDLVGSIMSTIKDILAEAEPLWLSTKRRIPSEKEAQKASREKKIPIVWDKTRFEDLVKDLTASIDTLYDLSRTRSSAASSSRLRRLSKSGSSEEELRPFESTRMQTPQQIDPQTLKSLKSIQPMPIGSPIASTERPQYVVFMSKQAYSDLTRQPGRQQWSPLLLEHAHFDPIYSTTGIMPSMTRFEKLSSGLQTESHRSPGAWIGLPLLLGYYEDLQNSRLGLVYQFPPAFNPVTFENLTQNPIDNLFTLEELLSRPDFEPRLEAKFRLAHNLANTVFDMHARGITHGNLKDSTISFCSLVANELGVQFGEVDIRKPLVSSFDLFSNDALSPPSLTSTLYRHPLDPRTTPQSPLPSNSDTKTLDLYSLAMLLVSIGLWTKLENLVPTQTSPSIPESVLEQLAIRCGTLYMKAVQACWNAVEQELLRPRSGDEILSQIQVRASRYLEACSILDGVSELDDRISDDISDVPEVERELQQSLTVPYLAGPSFPQERKPSVLSDQAKGDQSECSPAVPVSHIEDTTASLTPKPPTPKLRLYPHVPLPPLAIEQWNSTLMPQINMALGSFYRKNPESVEISLESIGESPQKTTPTVLVVCTSVNKVRTILKKKLGIFFDGSTDFTLKVYRGSVCRSRKGDNLRSAAKEGEHTAAANPCHQKRPNNGASIGAWVGDRHLPPVSFGGLIIIDDKPYGMTVHHMLDDPEQIHVSSPEKPGFRSSAAQHMFYMTDLESSAENSGSEGFACEFSDIDSNYSETEASSDEEEDNQYKEVGDIPGVEPGCGEGYVVTQPAFDDVEDDFFPSDETMEEDHLDSHRLGEVYASSGIRRREDPSGLIHEIDWALFEFEKERLPVKTDVPLARQVGKSSDSPVGSLRPTAVAPSSELPGLEVQCIARTSGLQTGVILPAITTVKIYGRTSPSHTYQVSGRASMATVQPSVDETIQRKPQGVPGLALGVPGDSGAWVIDRRNGQLCGHILAWSERKQVAYICPMDILLLDIAESLEANVVRLPGGEVVVERNTGDFDVALADEDLEDLIDEERDEVSHEAAEVERLTATMSDVCLNTGLVS